MIVAAAAAAANAKTFWFVTRGTGVVALLLLTASLVLGVLTTAGWRTARWPRFVSAGLHRNLTLLAVAFVVVHVVTTVADGYAPIGLKDAVIPFVSPYRPVWLGLGAVAFDLLLALIVTSLLRARFGYRMWRGVHWLAYISWPVALTHALGTGSDARAGWLAAVGFASLAVVAAAVFARLALSAQAPARRLAGAGGVVLAALGVLAWYHGGPAQAGWARRAGTPSTLLASGRVIVRPAPTRRAAIALPRAPFSASVNGKISESTDASGLVTVVITGRLHGGPGGSVRIDLRGSPADEGVAMTASGVSFVPAGTNAVYTGSVTALSGQQVESVVRTGSGQRLQLQFALNIDSGSGVVNGSVDGQPA